MSCRWKARCRGLVRESALTHTRAHSNVGANSNDDQTPASISLGIVHLSISILLSLYSVTGIRRAFVVLYTRSRNMLSVCVFVWKGEAEGENVLLSRCQTQEIKSGW